jgi:hypothetical protein
MGHLAQVVDVREVLDSIFSTAFKKRRKEKKELLACNFPDRSAKVSVLVTLISGLRSMAHSRPSIDHDLWRTLINSPINVYSIL